MQINGHSHAHAGASQSPARQAREAIATRPDLGEMTFGALVSRLARGQELPPAPTTAATDGAA